MTPTTFSIEFPFIVIHGEFSESWLDLGKVDYLNRVRTSGEVSCGTDNHPEDDGWGLGKTTDEQWKVLVTAWRCARNEEKPSHDPARQP